MENMIPDHNINYQDQILPCPFCGSRHDKLLIGSMPDKQKGYGIHCTNCDIIMTSVRIDKLILTWNIRIIPTIDDKPGSRQIKARKKLKEDYLNANWDLYNKIIDYGYHDDKSNPDYVKFITNARTYIGYSDTTLSSDIFMSFMRLAKHLKPQAN